MIRTQGETLQKKNMQKFMIYREMEYNVTVKKIRKVKGSFACLVHKVMISS